MTKLFLALVLFATVLAYCSADGGKLYAICITLPCFARDYGQHGSVQLNERHKLFEKSNDQSRYVPKYRNHDKMNQALMS